MTIVTDTFILRIINFDEIVNDILKNFRKNISEPPTCERDVQKHFRNFYDVIEYNFLKEKERVTYCGKDFVPDFTYLILNMAIEIKFVNTKEKIKKIMEEMVTDIAAYSQKWKYILFIVYDKGKIRNVDRFTREFHHDNDNKIRCIVIKE